ncbi:hypothetical protein LTR08_004489 [Meristemomyces frigidus]|nr:hypothetical protein LTR08_004489 [Meristemomyces frigidus]
MAIRYLILLSRQGKVRLAKWFTTLSPREKSKIVKDVTQLVLARRTRMCNFLEYKDTKVVYRRYASLFFIAATDPTDNELITLEIVHRYVEQMDKYYGNVCELDIIFNFQKAYFILDELLLAGELQESSRKNVLRCIGAMDGLEDMEYLQYEQSIHQELADEFSSVEMKIESPPSLRRAFAVSEPPDPRRQANLTQYLPLADLDIVTNSLNFSTPDCHVIGGCDIYTTKAAGRDKKLYKEIEQNLESQYESLVRLSASLSPPRRDAGVGDNGKGNATKTEQDGARKRRSRTVEAPDIDLSRDSPFGPLSEINARRTFAYLIATLNASHPDYDFSHLLRPTDFRREPSLRRIMQTVDYTLQNLRPQPKTLYLAPPTLTTAAPCIANSAGNEVWSARMWNLMDRALTLRACDRYSYVPEDDPFDGGEEGEGPAIWSMHFFFFNRVRKRVGYLYLRGLSVISHSPVHAPTLHSRFSAPGGGRRGGGGLGGSVSVGEGAGKRASYWLGETGAGEAAGSAGHADGEFEDDDGAGDDGGDDDDRTMTGADAFDPEDDEVEVPRLDLDDIRGGLAEGYYSYDAGDYGFAEDEEAEEWAQVGSVGMGGGGGVGGGGIGGADHDLVVQGSQAHPVVVRGVSEEVGDAMEL